MVSNQAHAENTLEKVVVDDLMGLTGCLAVSTHAPTSTIDIVTNENSAVFEFNVLNSIDLGDAFDSNVFEDILNEDFQSNNKISLDSFFN